MRKLPLLPKNPERVCWGCEKLCPAHDLACGNGTERTQHPVELFGDDWFEWSQELRAASDAMNEPSEVAGSAGVYDGHHSAPPLTDS